VSLLENAQYLSKIILKKKVKKGAKYTLFSQSKQNNNFIFQKGSYIYFLQKNMILGMAPVEFKKGQ